jgi:hypothetical protein
MRVGISRKSHPMMANELPSKNERQNMHLVLFTPILAIGTASSGVAFIVILAVLAALRGK